MAYCLPPTLKLLITSVNMMAKTATVTIRGSHELAIGVKAVMVLLIAVDASEVIPLVEPNLPKTRTPTPKIMPVNTRSRTS